MQFHLNGYRTGDPDLTDPAPGSNNTGTPPDQVDVLIVGAGPTGLTLAAQLASFPELATCVIEQKNGPLEVGQADGVACRTVEMFNAFGFADRVLREAYWVNETVFWKPDPDGSITRSDRIQDTEDGLSEFPHVILNQARVHDFFLDVMRKSPRRLEPFYGCQLGELDTSGHDPVAIIEFNGEQRRIQARYVVGCDGARSRVRGEIGQELIGAHANQAWGVMDVLAVTDFPDIRLKALIQSADQGNLLIIPREGGYMVRLYIEMDKLAPNERVTSKTITVDHLIAAAGRILAPYSLDVREVAWWSVYEIGQRLCTRFDDAAEDPRVFIAGDACHTHSPKAGQGMNVSMQDSFNLGWKLGTVLSERANPAILQTYDSERRAVAQELIDFDRDFAALFSAPAKSPTTPDGVDPTELQRYFTRHGRFTAGVETQYAASMLCGVASYQALAKGFTIGRRFHSAPVVRVADGRKIHLGHTSGADGRWRIYVFCDASRRPDSTENWFALCNWLMTDAASPVVQYTTDASDPDAVIDVRAVLQDDHRSVDLGVLPAALLPKKGRLGLIDYEKVFAVDPTTDIFDVREINRDGCMVVVRPDQYVAHVLPLSGRRQLSEFFDGFLLVL